MRGGWVFLVPLGVLLYTLMIGSWEAGKAGMLAVGVTLLVGCLQKATRPSWRECHGRGRGHRADDAGPHRHHDPGRHRDRRVSALRADVEAAHRAHQRRGRQRLPPARPHRGGLHPARHVAAHHGGLRHPRRADRAGARAARHRAAGRAPVPVLLRDALADHPARLPGHLRGRRHRQGRLLEDGLDGDASGRGGLRGAVRLRVPSGPDRPRHARGDPGHDAHRVDRRGAARHRVRGLPLPAAVMGRADLGVGGGRAADDAAARLAAAGGGRRLGARPRSRPGRERAARARAQPSGRPRSRRRPTVHR